jgi:hypothetical protein
MKKAGIMPYLLFLMLAVVSCLPSGAFAATDGYYQILPTTTTWDGTDANRLETTTAGYTCTYGDEASVTYVLPWAFSFYGQSFTQITADTNGNIWFGSTGASNSINLANNGRGPVIAAWNNDLSSYYYGGVFIQHKINPESVVPDRVVIEWQTETYTNEGLRRPNNFEVVLLPNGNINLDYKSFTAADTNRDFGSGVSLNDGSFYLNLSSVSGNVYTLGGQSFALTAGGTTQALDVSFSGGRGTVNSNVGVSWSASNPANIPKGAHVVMQSIPELGYNFAGWSGPCGGSGNCQFTLNQDTTVIASYTVDTSMQLILSSSGVQNRSLQTAYDMALPDDTLMLMATDFFEDFNVNQNETVTIKGGYNNNFTSNTAGASVLNGVMTITNGKVIASGFKIRGVTN